MLQYINRQSIAREQRPQDLSESAKNFRNEEELEREMTGSLVAQQHVEPEKPDDLLQYAQATQPLTTPDQNKRKSVMEIKKQIHQDVIRQLIDKDVEAKSQSLKLQSVS